MNTAVLSFHPSGCRLYAAETPSGDFSQIGLIQLFGGAPSGNTLRVICNPDDRDSGQGLLMGAINKALHFRMIFKDGGSASAPSSRRFAGIVRSASIALDEVKWVMLFTAEIEIAGAVTKNAAGTNQDGRDEPPPQEDA